MGDFLVSPSSVYEIVGLCGAATYVGAYFLAALDRVPSQSSLFYALQAIAALMVAVSLVVQFNTASAVIQSFFFMVSVWGMVRHSGQKRQARALSRSAEAIRGAGLSLTAESGAEGGRHPVHRAPRGVFASRRRGNRPGQATR